jgi:glycerophosphoryl diester phosphodiesterase
MSTPKPRCRRVSDSQCVLRVSLLALCFWWLGHSELRAAESDIKSAALQVTQMIAHRGASAERPECTLAAIRRAIEVGATAVEVDVRTSNDGELFILHDATVDRTTSGAGPASALTLAQLQQLDAGSWFDFTYRGERIPSLIQAAEACRGRIDLLLDLKEQGDDYDTQVAGVIHDHGDPAMTIVGVRSVAQAIRFRTLLPEARQLALIPSVDSIEEFAKAGVDTIRLWPRWLEDGDQPTKRVRASGKRLHLNGTMGEMNETLELLAFEPDSLSSDHPGRLKKTLQGIARGELPANQLAALMEQAEGARLTAGQSHVGARTFLNRDYRMLEVPDELSGMPRYSFNGGDGDKTRLRFRHPAVVFAAFDYNDTGLWSFPDGRPPTDFGWHLWRRDAYRGSSNAEIDGKPHRASIWFREFRPGQELTGLPMWWLCLGVVDLKTARGIEGFKAGRATDVPPPVRHFSHAAAAAGIRSLAVPEFESVESYRQWQTRQRQRFVDRMLYSYEGKIAVSVGSETRCETHLRREFHVTIDGSRLFRFFRLEPLAASATNPRPTIVCFMGHGKVAQILDDESSYQHACAANFVEAGYLVYAMENIGMEPGRDTHRDLDQSLRLQGHGWYSLLFAHQRILLDQVFADPTVDPQRVGATGVSTGGLLALSAAVIEPRIAASSVQGIFGSMRVSFIRDRHRHCSCGAIPGLLPEFDLPELTLLVAPRPLHISNGKTDGFSPAEAKRSVELIAPLYQRAGGRKPLVTVSPGGHEFSFAPALKFFAEHLNVR